MRLAPVAALTLICFSLFAGTPSLIDSRNVAGEVGLVHSFPNGGAQSKQYIIETTGSGAAFVLRVGFHHQTLRCESRTPNPEPQTPSPKPPCYPLFSFLDHSAGDSVSSIASRIGHVVIRLFVDDQRSAPFMK